MELKSCSKCGSRFVAGPKRIWGAGLDVGSIMGGKIYVAACIDCGHLELSTDEKAIERIKKNWEFDINPPNPQVKECPNCGRTFRKNTFYCKRCGSKRDFEYLESVEEF